MTDLTLTIEGVLGITYAEVPLEAGRITEVLGPNASGKTSVATCAQAVLAHHVNPMHLTAADAKRCYPNDGTDPAESRAVLDVSLLDDESGEPMAWDVVWRPPSGTITAPAVEPLARPEAVGLVDWRARKDAAGRAEALQSALLPPPEIVARALGDKLRQYLPEEDVVGVLEILAEYDTAGWGRSGAGEAWDRAWTIYKERARKAKSDWRAITTETWGSAKAADWRPTEWLTDWDRLSPTAAKDLLNTAREEHETLLRVSAITEAEAAAAAEATAKAKALSADIETMEATERQIEADMAAVGRDNLRMRLTAEQDGLEAAEATVEALSEKLETAKTDPSIPCPHCSGPLIVSGLTQVRAFDTEGQEALVAELTEQIAAAKKAITAAKGKVRKADQALQRADEKLEPLRAELGEIGRSLGNLRGERDLQARLGAVKGTVVGAEHSQAVSRAEQAVEDARRCAEAVDAAHRARDIHESVVRYVDVAKALGPQGVRATMLDDGLTRLGRALGRIAAITGWPAVDVSATGTVLVADRPVPMCSESEQWRAQAAIQLALGVITDSQVVVLDRADLLDAENRAYLHEALGRILTGCPWLAVLVCATGEDFLTDSEAIGHRVWLRGGESIVAAEIVEDQPEEEPS